MIRTVQCSACSTSFPVDPRKVPEDGVYARCSACQAVFFVEGGMAMAAAAPAAAAAPENDTFDATPAPTTVAPPQPSGLENQPDAWVFETDPEIDPSTVKIERLDTVEERQRKAKEETPSFSQPGGLGAPTTPAAPPPQPVKAAPAAAAAPAPAAPSKFTFGKRDPHEKASRLARVLVSDMVTYNPERHQKALDSGSIKQDFADEIKKSWGEYVDQVGRDLAESTEYFNQALNEILARGQKLF